MNKQTIANGLQIAGAIAVSVAGFLVFVPLGLVLAGTAAIATGVLVERD
jgi:dolichol kinase